VLRERDPLAVLQEGSLEGGQFTPFEMAPNFEITMYLAQATGSCIVTDSVFRWRELIAAARHGIQGASPLVELRAGMERATFVFPNDVQEIGLLAERGVFRGYPSIMRKVFNYLSRPSTRGPKPNFESSLIAEFKRVQTSTVPTAKKSAAHLSEAQISCLWPAGGIQDNTVNRLLLMSSSEHHLASAPMGLVWQEQRTGAAIYRHRQLDRQTVSFVARCVRGNIADRGLRSYSALRTEGSCRFNAQSILDAKERCYRACGRRQPLAGAVLPADWETARQ
jgi:hypothetical protein